MESRLNTVALYATYCTMDVHPKWPVQIAHHEYCSCRLLAQAMGCDPRSISFEYCRRVLQKHWQVDCRHGQSMSGPAAGVRNDP